MSAADQRTLDLEIVETKTLVAVPRGSNEELRLDFVRGRLPGGKETAWHSLRVWWRGDDGTMRPGKQGLTVRGKEIHAIAAGFLRAVASKVPPALHESARQIIATLEGGKS